MIKILKYILYILIFTTLTIQAQNQVVELCDDNKTSFTYTAEGDPYSSWSWIVYKDGGVILTSTRESISYTFKSAGNYMFTTQIHNVLCYSATQLFEVSVIECRVPTLYFPTTFTPNKDGINDLYKPMGTLITEYDFILFDRWGQIIFMTNSLDQWWDGTYNGVDCPTGIYRYNCKYKDVHGKRYTKMDNVILIR